MSDFGNIPINQKIGLMPSGGATDEVLKKASSSDYAVAWGAGGSAASYGWFGDASDGSYVATDTGISLPYGRAMFFDNLTINAGMIVRANSSVFVRNTLRIYAGGALHMDGYPATATTSNAAGGGGYLLNSGMGGVAGTTTSAGAAGVGHSLGLESRVPAGGAGGAGSGGAAGAASNVIGVDDLKGPTHGLILHQTGYLIGGTSGTGIATIKGGASGGSGSGDGGGRGGASGGGGGVFIVCARLIINDGELRAKGGSGFAPNSGTNVGGSGGSQGGTLLLTVAEGGLTGSGRVHVDGSPGTAGRGTGTAGGNGGLGFLRILYV